jgi:adenylosuccinate synthase
MTEAIIVTDLGFGDAGKGATVDYLARHKKAGLVVRFNGGAQAAHNVVTPDGRHHTFSQFGSATFIPGVRTHLSRFMLVNPLKLDQEAEVLAKKGVPDPLGLVTIDERALIITAYHQAANWIRELARGDNRHGSCGHGIGETMSDWLDHPDDAITAGNLADPRLTRAKLERIRLRKLAELSEVIAALPASRMKEVASWRLKDTKLSKLAAGFYQSMTERVQVVSGDHLDQLMQQTNCTLFEGAQGVLLDEWYGFHPYTTWSTTTNANAEQLLAEVDFEGQLTRLGLIRAYSTRHGAGPFVTEDSGLTAAIQDQHNDNNDWQQTFRIGYFDPIALRYALDVTGPIDGLVLNHLDRLLGQRDWQVCSDYKQIGPEYDPSSRNLIRAPSPDLVYQEGLTNGLFQAAPRYTTFKSGVFTEDDFSDYRSLVEQEADLPVVLTSSGLAATDRQCHGAMAEITRVS